MNKTRKRSLRLLCELLCLALAICMIVGALPTVAEETAAPEQTDMPDTVTVIKASKDIPRGTRITDEHIEAVTVKNINIPKNIISDPAEVADQYAEDDIFAGEYISKDRISEKAVAKVNTDLLIKSIKESSDDYVVVTDYVIPNTGEDMSALLQDIIDENPNRHIIFPAGEYTISYPLCTPALAKQSVSILLADGAVIKASDEWKSKNGNNALIALGGAAAANNINMEGSYYTLVGGMLDGNGKAQGVRISSGRESVVRNICIKNVEVGVLVADGANNGSSDCDFEDVTIIGTGRSGTIGVSVIGYDNTFTNIRIYNMHKGFLCTSGGNLLKSIHVYNTTENALFSSSTVGIHTGSNQWISECYVENCATAYNFDKGSAVSNCVARWTSDICKSQTAFAFSGKNMTMSGCRVEFFNGEGIATALTSGYAVKYSEADTDHASKKAQDEAFDFIEGTAVKGTITNKSYRKYLVGDIPLIELS